MQKSINLTVIIVNYNGKNVIEECLNSLKKQTFRNFNTIVVDNNSKDGSKDIITKRHKSVKLIELKENTGFCKANNLAINYVLSNKEIKYIVLLNNDTVCDKKFIEMMLKAVNFDKKTGMAACKMLFYNDRSIINNLGGYIRENGCFDGLGFGKKNSNEFNNFKEVFAPSGAAAIYKSQLLRDIQYEEEFFDELFFAYHEDIDLAWRARLCGWKCYYTPEAIVYHHHSLTFSNNSDKNYLCFKNNILTIYKCLSLKVFRKKGLIIILYFMLKSIKKLFFLDTTFIRAIIAGVLSFKSLKLKRRATLSKTKLSTNESLRILNIR